MARERLADDSIGPALKRAFGGVFIANDKFTQETAEDLLANGEADAVAFGKLFISNPDLPERFRVDARLNAPDRKTFYGGTESGYIDYPVLDAVEAAVR